MASENKRRANKQSTITFTLPLSCQICLGKVKQPVLCPNHHVFCQLCMDIWLEKNKQCPTCRVEINDNNPVKNIIGGQLEDEDVKKQSSAELRRARFELLYKEYEDQFDQMRKESIILRTENNILLAQLQDAEDKNDAQNKTEKETKASSSGKNEPNLLVLTKNLQEAQTLYVGIKEEMAQLKQENSKLKDENVNLTRENENLRLEIAQRSPKKFGRYTVATLETKLSEYEKEIRQLKKALERSDEYVEDLEKQIEKLSESRHKQNYHKSNGMKKATISREASEMNGHANFNGIDQSNFDSEENGNKNLDLGGSKFEEPISQDRESAKRILFSLCELSEDRSNKKLDHVDSKVSELDNENGEEIGNAKHPESIMKHGGGGETSHKQSSGRVPDSNVRISKTKKVHFNVPKVANTSVSFELEMPSPYGNDTQFSKQKENSQSNSKNGKEDGNLGENDDEVDGVPLLWSDFDTHVVSLLKKANVSTNSNSSHIPNIKLTNSGEFISKHEQVNHNPASKKIYEDSNDSSRLSLPDFDSPRKLTLSDSDGLSDSPRKPGMTDEDDVLDFDNNSGNKINRKTINQTELDISMTPEMSDCLRLMNQAEQKLEMPPTGVYSDIGTNHPSSLKTNPASFHLTSSHSSANHSKGPQVTYNSSVKPQSFSSSESMRSWEQEFFRGLQTNPYKPYKFNLPPSSTSSNSSDNKIMHGNMVQNGLQLSSSSQHDDFLSFKKNLSSLSHKNSSGLTTNTNTPALSSYHTNPKSFSSAIPSSFPYNSSTTNLHGGGLGISSNPLSLHFDKLQSFTTSIPISLSSSDHPYAAAGTTHNTLDRSPVSVHAPPPSSAASNLSSFSISKNPSAYSTSSSKDFHDGLYPSHSNISSGSSSHTFRNPLPPSLNNSSLEWPDSPFKNLTSSDPTDIGNSNNFLPLSSSLRDKNRFASASSPRNHQRRGNQDHIFTSANSSISSDVNNSSFLPEPKKRLFALDDELGLPNKTAKK